MKSSMLSLAYIGLSAVALFLKEMKLKQTPFFRHHQHLGDLTREFNN